jgi:hypothetical protein
MRNPYPITKSLLALAVVGVSLSACKDDDGDSPNTVSFVNSSLSVNEDDGTVEVEVKLDRAADQDIVVGYDISGTAADREDTGASGSYDFQISSDRGELTIPKGETTATINISIEQDGIFEEDETIELELSEASNNVKISDSKDAVIVTILDDETAEGRPKVSFAVASVTVNEADGLEGYTSVRILLDKAAPEALTLNYSIASNALDSITYSEDPTKYNDFDYFVNSEEVGVLQIPKGATEAVIELRINPIDFDYEPTDEVIAITLEGVTASAQLGTQKTTQVIIEEQNGEVVELNWTAASNDVDMDLFLWVPRDEETFTFRALAAREDETGPERLLIPDIITNGALGSEVTGALFGFSYIYYGGTENSLKFSVKVLHYNNGQLQSSADASAPTKTATYTLANINPWNTDQGTNPSITHWIVFEDGDFSEMPDIVVPEEGSRMRYHGEQLPIGLRKR